MERAGGERGRRGRGRSSLGSPIASEPADTITVHPTPALSHRAPSPSWETSPLTAPELDTEGSWVWKAQEERSWVKAPSLKNQDDPERQR